MHLKAHKVVEQGFFFLFFFSCNFDDQLSSNLHRFVILCILYWDTLTEDVVFDSYPKCPVPLKHNVKRYMYILQWEFMLVTSTYWCTFDWTFDHFRLSIILAASCCLLFLMVYLYYMDPGQGRVPGEQVNVVNKTA